MKKEINDSFLSTKCHYIVIITMMIEKVNNNITAGSDEKLLQANIGRQIEAWAI